MMQVGEEEPLGEELFSRTASRGCCDFGLWQKGSAPALERAVRSLAKLPPMGATMQHNGIVLPPKRNNYSRP